MKAVARFTSLRLNQLFLVVVGVSFGFGVFMSLTTPAPLYLSVITPAVAILYWFLTRPDPNGY